MQIPEVVESRGTYQGADARFMRLDRAIAYEVRPGNSDPQLLELFANKHRLLW